jgi:uncharacterized protein YkwD
MRGLVLVAAVAIAVGAAIALAPRDAGPRPASPCGAVDSQPANIDLRLAGQATLCLINRERMSRGLRPLVSNELLASAALSHSRDMVARRYFAHDSPDGRSVGDRLRAAGYGLGGHASAGENLAWGSGAKGTPASIVDKWMNSPPHRDDILRPSFTEIGIGIALGPPVRDAVLRNPSAVAATYTTDFGGAYDAALPAG